VTIVDLSRSTVLVTGATSGIGEATAERLAREGARLVVAGRRTDRLAALAGRLGVPVHALELDVRDRGALTRAVASLPPDFAAVDVLVNNAGLALGLQPAQGADLDEWEQMIDTNTRGLAVLTRLLLPGMVERGRGHVVNVGSVAGRYPYPGGNVYGATKAFVHQFSLNLRADLVGSGVRVTCVEPGMADTEFSLVRLQDAERGRAVYQGMQPLTAADVADAILWALTRPPHVNVNLIELMPEDQAFSPFAVKRR
jgi:3-hydroxy acid dehydrogenase / malonic semialdehyde reductase